MAEAYPPKPQCRVTIEDGRIAVRFPYDATLYQAIKRFKGARYDSQRRLWLLPFASAEKLERSRQFSRSKAHWQFDGEALAQVRMTQEQEREAARRVVSENPFAVPGDVIHRAEVESVFQEQKGIAGIFLSVPARSRARKLAEAIPGVHYVKRAKGFFTPTHELPTLLREFKRAGVMFAVEAELGAQLRRSAALRARVVRGDHLPEADEILETKLFPFADGVEGRFVIRGVSTELQRTLFPQGVTFREKCEALENLSLPEFCRCWLGLAHQGVRLWQTRSVVEALNEEGKEWRERLRSSDRPLPLADHVPMVVSDIPMWCLDWEGKPVLLAVNRLTGGVTKELESGCRRGIWELDRAIEVLRPTCAELPSLKVAVETDAEVLPATEGFSRLLEDVIRRENLRRRRKALLSESPQLKEFHNQELARGLFPHQRSAIRLLLQEDYTLIGDDMGLGKTCTVLAVIDELLTRGEIAKTLVVCPNSLVRNWEREARRWIPRRRFQILPESKRDRDAALRALERNPHCFDGLVVNYEVVRLPYVLPRLKSIFSSTAAFLCVDESQRVKNPTGKSFAALDELSGLFKRRVLLSGTPTPKNIADIWAQMKILDRGERLGKNYYEWLAQVAALGNEYSEYAIKRFFPDQVTEVVARVHEVLIRRRKDEVLDLPEKLFSVRDVPLTGDQRVRYQEVCDELRLRLTSVSGEEYTREIDNLLEEYLRAVQMASNPRLVDPKWQGEPAKFLELDEIVREIVEEREERIVIWSNYLGNIEELCQRYARHRAVPFSGLVSAGERDRTIAAFQAKEPDGPRILVAVPAAGGVGITLTAAQTAVYVEKTWNAEHWLQSIDRIHRIGQQGTVNIISLHASKVDEIIAANLRRKGREQEQLLSGAVLEEIPAYPSREELLEALSVVA